MPRIYSLTLLYLITLSLASNAKSEDSLPLVDVVKLVPNIVTDIRYAGSHNFMGRPVSGYEAAKCLLMLEAGQALARVQADIQTKGYKLKVFDCYRPKKAVLEFVEWAKDPKDNINKREFYPDVEKKDLFRLGYIARQSGHSRGSTVDITLISIASGEEIDMGSKFDLFSPRSNYTHKELSHSARENRFQLRTAMERGGFRPYATEWWHFKLKNEPFQHSVFDFDIR
jgi:D-alanyl-D-alanine dipeptidase